MRDDCYTARNVSKGCKMWDASGTGTDCIEQPGNAAQFENLISVS